MTCIVGILDKDGTIYMGGDSAGVGGLSLHIRADEKVFINKDMIMGFTHSFRMGQLLRYSFHPPDYYDYKGLYEYMVDDFINAVREVFKKGGFLTKKDEVERGGTFLVGFKQKLFYVMGDFQVGQTTDNYLACGCGEDLALGSLFATSFVGMKMDPEARIKLALEAAEKYSAGVRGPYKIIKLKPKGA